MKKSYLVFLCLLSAIILLAQSPQAFNYQTVVRDNTGNILSEQDVAFRISILKGSADGTSVYSETHLATSNTFGLVNLEIGKGTVGSGTFEQIRWGLNEYFLQIEMDEAGETNGHHTINECSLFFKCSLLNTHTAYRRIV